MMREQTAQFYANSPWRTAFGTPDADEPELESGDRFRSLRLRSLDVIVAFAALVWFAPLMVLIALAILVGDRGPVFFSHERIGRGGRTFKCLKFRSMAVNSNERLQALLASDPQARQEWELDRKLRNDPRVTFLGRFLRKSSLDELPQLINVLRGDMSVVGPRPIVAEEIARYGRYFTHYCRVRPGLTGLWQISGRNDVSYRRRVALDVAYSRSLSLALNTRILLATIPKVLLQRGSY